MPEACREVSIILVATDLSEESAAAIRFGHWLGDKLGASVEAAHVIEPLSHGVLAAAPELEKAHREEAERKLREFATANGLEGRTKVHVATGDLVAELLKMQHQTRADLVLVGRPRGREAMGATGAGMARKMPVSVLVVPPDGVEQVAKIGVATDLTENSELGVRRGLELAHRLGLTEITLLHTYEVPVGYHTIATYDEICQRIEKNSRERAEAFTARIQAESPGALQVRMAMTDGTPAEAIPKLAGEENLDLLIVSTHGRASGLSVFMGRKTEKILGRAPCAVWAERSPSLFQSALDALGELLR
jgi:nucleotide-binding universal stress UspA family protein